MPSAQIKRQNQALQDDVKAIDQSVLLRMLGYNCLQAYLVLVPSIKKLLAKYSLKPAEFSVLALVKSNPDVNQKRLGQAINISPPNLATLLDRMESNGLLTRQRNPSDKRSQVLVLTPKGSNLCDKAQAATAKLDTVPGLSDAEHATLMLLLQKVFLPLRR